MSQERFRDRVEAGQLLGKAVAERVSDRSNPIVLALPRGGVPVGYEVARASARLWTFSSSGSLAFPVMKSWPWERSPAAACAS